MKWTDTYEIVDALIDAYPEQDPKKLLFTDLMNMVCSLEPVSYTHLRAHETR